MPADTSTAAAAAGTAAPRTSGADATQGPSPRDKTRLRQQLFGGLAAAVLLAIVLFALWFFLVGSRRVVTDDAYVGADVAQVTPLVAGAVTEVRVADTQAVKAGDVLVVIDPADTRLAIAQAQAEYGRAQRRVRQDLATNGQFAAQITARDADIARARAQLVAGQSDVQRTQVDLQRRQALAASGAVSGEELTTAKNAYATAVANLDAIRASGAQAQANLEAAKGQLAAQSALTEGADLDANPEVAAARAALDTARLNASRTVLRAPFDGVISRRAVQVGQRVAVGADLMSVVPIDRLYVDANFKEVQLRKVRPGQRVAVTSDLYGPHVVYHGRVVGFAGGTGSAFAVIPAQNATGNWIKVVQRLPVRVALDPAELRQHPLRVGLSMNVDIDTADAPPGPAQPAA